jgi:hypothetical protein
MKCVKKLHKVLIPLLSTKGQGLNLNNTKKMTFKILFNSLYNSSIILSGPIQLQMKSYTKCPYSSSRFNLLTSIQNITIKKIFKPNPKLNP